MSASPIEVAMLSASPRSEAPSTASGLPLQSGADIHRIPQILPRERVFPIQIGGELFKLSGASLSSDGSSRLDYQEPSPRLLTFSFSIFSKLQRRPIFRNTSFARLEQPREKATTHLLRSGRSTSIATRRLFETLRCTYKDTM